MKSIEKCLLYFFFDFLNSSTFATFIRYFMLLFVTSVKEFFSKQFALSTKRIAVLIFISCVLPWWIVWNRFGFLLDDVLFPDWRKQAIVKPLFIIGHARSGTTWLHRRITCDETDIQFSTFRTWELLFGLSVTWNRLFLLLYRADLHFYGIMFRTVTWIENVLIRDMLQNSDLHRVGLQLPEEDEWILAHCGASQLLLFLFPLAGPLLGPLLGEPHRDRWLVVASHSRGMEDRLLFGNACSY